MKNNFHFLLNIQLFAEPEDTPEKETEGEENNDLVALATEVKSLHEALQASQSKIEELTSTVEGLREAQEKMTSEYKDLFVKGSNVEEDKTEFKEKVLGDIFESIAVVKGY